MKISRKDFLKVSSLVLASAVVTPLIYFGIKNEVDEPVVKQVVIPVRNLSESLEGFRIAAMTDFHLYPLTRPEWIQKGVDLANALKPDLGVFLGDYVWHDLDAIFDLAPILAGLNASQGLFSIIGNHDIWLDVEVVKQGLVEAGIPVLVNQGLSFTRGKDQLNLVGLDDGWIGHMDLNAAMDGLSNHAPTIVLQHVPDAADVIARDPRINLQLSGHTHGGQVRINDKPIVAPQMGKKYNYGLYQVGGMYVYTNAGIGVIDIPLRYNCPPEVTDIILTRA